MIFVLYPAGFYVLLNETQDSNFVVGADPLDGREVRINQRHIYLIKKYSESDERALKECLKKNEYTVCLKEVLNIDVQPAVPQQVQDSLQFLLEKVGSLISGVKLE